MFRSPLLIGLLLVALILTGCATNTPAPQPGTTAVAVAEAPHGPHARAWLIGDGTRLVAQLDPAAALAELAPPSPAAPIIGAAAVISGTAISEGQAPMPTPRTVVLPPDGSAPPTPVPTAAPASLIPVPAPADAQAAWIQPVSAWMELGMDAIARARLTPNRAARDLAILSVALNDSYFVLDAARAQKIEVSEEALLAAAARQALNTSHPTDAAVWQQAYDVAVWMGAWKNHDSAQAVANGIQLGKAVADAVLDGVRGDGATAPQTFDWPESIIPPGQPTPVPPVDRWRPMLPDQPIDPLWGNVHLIGLPSTAGLVAAAPPNWDAVAFADTRTAFANTQHALTDEQRQIARNWVSGTRTLAGLWFAQAHTLVSGAHLDNRATAQVYAALTITLHNAFVVSWADAYRYLVPRPTNWMHASDPAWSPVVPAPSAPSYPSDAAVVSAAAVDVLAAFFPAQTTQLAAAADEAARSQVYAGVHWQIDTDAGADQGRRVGQAMLTLIR
jgi:membrane-associated phospholipid phosphatase